MTVFLTPDGDPFYGGTYFPKPNFLQLMAAIDRRLAQPPRRGRPRTATRCARPSRARPACSRPTSCPARPHLDRTVQALAAGVRPRVGRLRRGAEVPVDDEPRPRPARRHLRSGDPAAARDRHDVARRDGVGRHVRPHRRRLRPLLRRPRVARAALREDALRPGAARAGLRPRRGRPRRAARWRQVVAETVEYVLRDLRQPAGGFSSAEDADSPGPDGHGHEGLFHTWTRRRGARRARRRRRRRARAGAASRAEGNFEGRSIPNRLHAVATFGPPAGGRGRPAGACSTARERRPRPGPRRQGAHRVERA